MANTLIAVIGGGAGGLMAAGRAAECGGRVILLEKMAQPGSKLLLTGNGRCNYSNNQDIDRFIKSYGDNGRFLYSAFSRFFRDELMALLSKHGVGSVIEDDGRVFPASGKAADVLKVLIQCNNKTDLKLRTAVREIVIEDGKVVGVRTDIEIIPVGAVVLATGGMSYPSTGSTGDGYHIAQAMGHRIVKLRPALVPLAVEKPDIVRRLQGMSVDARVTGLSNPAAEISSKLLPRIDCGRGIEGKQPKPPVIESRRGEIVFTHFGLSGPTVLQMSLAMVDALEKGPVNIAIDLFPDTSNVELSQQLQDEMDAKGRKVFRNTMNRHLPDKLARIVMEIAQIEADTRNNQIKREERERVAELLKCFCLKLRSALSTEAAMVTAGGVALDEIDPRTMGSRLVQGLYFCGEVMDLDGETGGYNLQAAFSTGFVAGQSTARYVAGR